MKLIKKDNKTLALRLDNGHTIENHIATMIFYLVEEQGFEPDEILIALEEMNKMNHTHAEFGVMKRFIFTHNEKREENEEDFRIQYS